MNRVINKGIAITKHTQNGSDVNRFSKTHVPITAQDKSDANWPIAIRDAPKPPLIHVLGIRQIQRIGIAIPRSNAVSGIDGRRQNGRKNAANPRANSSQSGMMRSFIRSNRIIFQNLRAGNKLDFQR